MAKANADLQQDQEDDLVEGEELETGKEDGSDGDSRTKSESEDQHEDHHEDDSDDISDEERELIRQRRREERQRKKQVQREREDSLRREIAARDELLNEMRQRLDLVERRSTGSEIAQLDAKIKEASDASSWFKAQIAAAYESGNHAAAADYTEKMVAAREEASRLANIKTSYSQRQQQPQTLDPRVRTYGEQFMSEHRWLDLNGKDEDSRIALTVDAGLTREGWDPRTPQYWDEYKARLKKYLPHRYVSGSVETRRESRKSVVTGSGRESSSGASKSEYNLSPERVQALKEAGAWDNPEKRTKMIKAYREYDKNRS